MANASSQSVKDQLLSQVELVRHRLDWYRDGLVDAAEHTQEAFDESAGRIQERCDELSDAITERSAVDEGTASAVHDLGSAVDTLEADTEAASETMVAGYWRAVDRQARAWRSRADQLRLRSALGGMEMRDELADAGSRLDAARAGVIVELRNAAGDTRDLLVDVRDDVEEVLVDVRHLVERFADALTQKAGE